MIIEALVLSAALVQTPPEPPVKNPRGVTITCPDHDRDDQHEVDIVRVSDGQVVQTILAGDPAPNSTGDVDLLINVQPIAFGQYRFVVRAVAGSLKSENSQPSEIWERAPGAPSIKKVK